MNSRRGQRQGPALARVATFGALGIAFVILSFLLLSGQRGSGRFGGGDSWGGGGGESRRTARDRRHREQRRVLVAGCARNGANILPLALERIARLCALSGFACDAFVYENDSSDGTLEVLEAAREALAGGGRDGALDGLSSLAFDTERGTGLGRMGSIARCRERGLGR